MNPAPLSETDTRLLRAAIVLSARARAAGNQPYGAVLADAHGRVLLEACNTQVTTRDCTGHADELGAQRAEILATGARQVEVVGPALEHEARQVFEQHPSNSRS